MKRPRVCRGTKLLGSLLQERSAPQELEWNIVVEIAETATVRRRLGLVLLRGRPVFRLAVVIVSGWRIVSPAGAASTIEHLHLAGDDFRGVTILAILSLPLAGAQRALDIDF